MARMTREEFETAVRVAIAENISTGTPCSCCGVAEIEGIDDAVKAIGSTFEDAEVSLQVRRWPAPLVSDATIAEVAAMEERDRLAGGPPWEVPDHPDNFQPGGWHHGQITGRPAPGWS